MYVFDEESCSLQLVSSTSVVNNVSNNKFVIIVKTVEGSTLEYKQEYDSLEEAKKEMTNIISKISAINLFGMDYISSYSAKKQSAWKLIK